MVYVVHSFIFFIITSRKTSFTEPTRHNEQLASYVHQLPATLAISTVHLVGGLPTVRLSVYGGHSRILLSQRVL